MKLTGAIKRLENKGYAVEFQSYQIIASKEGFREIQLVQNGHEDNVAVIQVGASYPSTLKRALELSERLAR